MHAGAVCPYRSVNYITHSLAQQCVATSRLAGWSQNPTEASSSSDVISQTPTIEATSSDPVVSNTTLVQKEDKGRSDANPPTVVQPTASATVAAEEADSESPLGKDNFLSFEEWKRRNLDKYGQSPDQVGRSKKHETLRPRRPAINVLDSLGEDAEIDLDFSAFASEKARIAGPGHKDALNTDAGDQNRGREIPKTTSRSKDAGTTFNERFNYASFDCAATILKTNAKSSGSSAVLVENKDSYMLNECSVENKFLVLELCEDILIDTIVLANFEFFSSIFHTFRVSVSDKYPVKSEKWKELGTFEARNTREVQAFLVENPLIWAKYVRLEFQTHYGNEFYCPISLVRVHGTTMLEDYRHDEDSIKAEDRDDDEDDQVISTPEMTDTATPGAGAGAVAENLVGKESSENAAEQVNSFNVTDSALEKIKHSSSKTASSPYHESHGHEKAASERLPHSIQNARVTLFDLAQQQCPTDGGKEDQVLVEPVFTESPKTPLPGHSIATTGDASERLLQHLVASSPRTTTSRHSSMSIDVNLSERSPTTKQSLQPSDSSSPIRTTSRPDSNSNKPPASPTQPPSSNPTIQESFFKSVQKRLQMLESNSTLSLQYIEEQSRMLRDAFSKVEERQLSKTTKFLEYLNETVLNELRDFRRQYDQLWQSTVIELETHRERSQHEVIAVNIRLSILADELVFQKRMAILQSILVLLCIGLVLFSRGSVNSYLEHPLVQNMLTRSATFKIKGSFFDTPSMSPESTRPNSSYRTQAKAAYRRIKGHRQNLSEDSQDGTDNPAIAYSPPTPASYDGHSDVEDGNDVPVISQSLSRKLTDVHRSNDSPRDLHHPIENPDTLPKRTGEKDGQGQSSLSSTVGAQSEKNGSTQQIHGEDVPSSQARPQAPEGRTLT
jgi:Sad1 / UNC-like C-terminal